MKKALAVIFSLILCLTAVTPVFARAQPLTMHEKRHYLTSICGLPTSFIEDSSDDIVEEIYQEAMENYIELESISGG